MSEFDIIIQISIIMEFCLLLPPFPRITRFSVVNLQNIKNDLERLKSSFGSLSLLNYSRKTSLYCLKDLN